MAVSFLSHAVIQGIADSTATRTGAASVNASADFVLVKVLWGNLGPTPNISSVTYDGDTCTSVGSKLNATIAGLPTSTQMFRLSAPSTGSNTLTVNFASATHTSTAVIEGYSGVDGTTSVEGLNTTSGTGTSITLGPTTTTVADDIITGMVTSQQGSTANLSTSDTEIVEIDYTALAAVVANLAYDEVTGSGETVAWTTASSQPYAAQVIALKAASVSGDEEAALTGSTATHSQGDIASNIDYALTGNSDSFAQGDIGHDVSYTLTGQEIASSQGDISLEIEYTLSGEEVATDQGELSASAASETTAALTGGEITSQVGDVSPDIVQSLSGQAITSEQGSVSHSVGQNLIGEESTVEHGDVTALVAGNVTIELTGTEITSSQGGIQADSGSTSSGGGASGAGYWKEWWNKPSYKEAVKKKKLSPKAKEIVKEVAKTLPADTDEITKDQEIALRLKLIADHIGYNPLYLDGLRQELINQQLENEQALQKEEEEAIAMLMMMLV